MKTFVQTVVIIAAILSAANLNTPEAQVCNTPYKIVVLGSSNAWGRGADPIDSAWVYRYSYYLKQINANYAVYNLAVKGATTYRAQKSSYIPPPGRPYPDKKHNITAAFRLDPNAIIIAFPSNDAANNYTLSEQKANFLRITKAAAKKNIPVWVTTSAPRNNFSDSQVANQKALYQWVINEYGTKSIDIWTGMVSANDSLLFQYDSGDGIHLNNAGHYELFTRITAADLPDSLCLRSSLNASTLFPLYKHSRPLLSTTKTLVYPNPTPAILFANPDAASSARTLFEVYDERGIAVFTDIKKVIKGNVYYKLKLPFVRPGVYNPLMQNAL